MTLFRLTLLFNVVTFAVTLAAAIRRPILSYKLIALLALCGTALSLHEVLTDRANGFTPWVTALLVAFMMGRIGSNLRGRRRQKHR